MIVTPDMPREPGSSVEWSGALIELAEIIGEDDTGVKVTADSCRQFVTLDVDAFAYPHSRVYLTPDDAEELGKILIKRATEARG